MADVPTVQMRGLQGSRETVGLTAWALPADRASQECSPLSTSPWTPHTHLTPRQQGRGAVGARKDLTLLPGEVQGENAGLTVSCIVWPNWLPVVKMCASNSELASPMEGSTKTRSGASLVTESESACQHKRRGFGPWSRKVLHAAGRLSLSNTATEAVLQSPGATTGEAPVPCN